MTLPSTRLRRIPVLGEVLNLPVVGGLIKRFVDDVLPILVRGFVYGCLAFAVGFGLLWFIVDYVNPGVSGFVAFLLDLADITLPGPRLIAGWVFYMAHGVALRIPDGLNSSTTANFLDEGYGRALFLYPPLLLALTGAIAARAQRALKDGAIVGASIAVGYTLAFLYYDAGLVWQEKAIFWTLTVELAPGPRYTLRALAYPLVFGGLGGIAAVKFDFPPSKSDIPLVSRFL